jgi:hypothetical protein
MRTSVSVGDVDECVHGTERFMMNCWLFAAGAVLAPCTCITHVLTHTQDWLSPAIGSPALHLSGSLTWTSWPQWQYSAIAPHKRSLRPPVPPASIRYRELIAMPDLQAARYNCKVLNCHPPPCTFSSSGVAVARQGSFINCIARRVNFKIRWDRTVDAP